MILYYLFYNDIIARAYIYYNAFDCFKVSVFMCDCVFVMFTSFRQ
jgi:hypothetical protein